MVAVVKGELYDFNAIDGSTSTAFYEWCSKTCLTLRVAATDHRHAVPGAKEGLGHFVGARACCTLWCREMLMEVEDTHGQNATCVVNVQGRSTLTDTRGTLA